ncbi:MAG: hypothetical protein HPAVJP_3390 [Candidatus Hepatoplasma vulgare]|nr:MAG: hypothetical protein HPAVJP_3390 [Candidatus Hepatoplasma sp.]
MSEEDYLFWSIIVVAIIALIAIIIIQLKVRKLRKILKKKESSNIKLILIGGGSGSGKSFISNKLAEEIKKNKRKVTIIRMDHYYKSIENFSKNFEKINFDSPKVIDWKTLIKDIDSLRSGIAINQKIYNFATGEYYKDKNIKIEPGDFIILEGIFVFYNKEINLLANEKIFIEANEKTRWRRRLERDKKERYTKKNEEELKKIWENRVLPMHKKYIEKTKKHVNDIIENNNDKNQKYINEKINEVYEKITKL